MKRRTKHRLKTVYGLFLETVEALLTKADPLGIGRYRIQAFGILEQIHTCDSEHALADWVRQVFARDFGSLFDLAAQGERADKSIQVFEQLSQQLWGLWCDFGAERALAALAARQPLRRARRSLAGQLLAQQHAVRLAALKRLENEWDKACLEPLIYLFEHDSQSRMRLLAAKMICERAEQTAFVAYLDELILRLRTQDHRKFFETLGHLRLLGACDDIALVVAIRQRLAEVQSWLRDSWLPGSHFSDLTPSIFWALGTLNEEVAGDELLNLLKGCLWEETGSYLATQFRYLILRLLGQSPIKASPDAVYQVIKTEKIASVYQQAWRLLKKWNALDTAAFWEAWMARTSYREFEPELDESFLRHFQAADSKIYRQLPKADGRQGATEFAKYLLRERRSLTFEMGRRSGEQKLTLQPEAVAAFVEQLSIEVLHTESLQNPEVRAHHLAERIRSRPEAFNAILSEALATETPETVFSLLLNLEGLTLHLEVRHLPLLLNRLRQSGKATSFYAFNLLERWFPADILIEGLFEWLKIESHLQVQDALMHALNNLVAKAPATQQAIKDQFACYCLEILIKPEMSYLHDEAIEGTDSFCEAPENLEAVLRTVALESGQWLGRKKALCRLAHKPSLENQKILFCSLADCEAEVRSHSDLYPI